ncbi:hypothetical protein COLSTE_00932 [Collinsella stercoris DSM 13279]|uniref:Uncharacterized protein n=1 Tax=Collinsella stercoris DSM 13279 TaxID=445975 RepID=B6GA39_9ACTN|nr:hypothetical protein COLSTE_00932 [Collinsella stercoris DSM 13279]
MSNEYVRVKPLMRWCVGGFVVSVPPIGFCAVIDREVADT